MLFVESLDQPEHAARFPATDAEFRGRFLTIVKNHAMDCVRDRHVTERHSHWAKAPEPTAGGRKVADRELDLVFARNDHGRYDAPAPTERHVKDDLDELHQILRCHLEELSPMQAAIIVETFFEKRKRAEVAARHGISVSTYNNHLQAAFRALRASFQAVVDISSGIDLPPWYERIAQVLERRAGAHVRRLSRKTGKRSTARGERGNFEGERSNVEGERGTSGHERDNNARAGAVWTVAASESSGEGRDVEGERGATRVQRDNIGHERRTVGHERRAVRGERDDVAHERGKVRHERRNVGHERGNAGHERYNIAHERRNVRRKPDRSVRQTPRCATRTRLHTTRTRLCTRQTRLCTTRTPLRTTRT